MKFYTTLLAVLFSIGLSAQSDIFDMFDGMLDKTVLPTNITKIVEMKYNTMSFDEEAKPATTMKIGKDTLELYFVSKTETTYPDSKSYTEVEYDKEGAKSITYEYKYNDLGQMTSWVTDMGDRPAAALMNSKKEYTYDEKGRITSIMNDGKEAGKVKYGPNGDMKALIVDMGFAKMKVFGDKEGNKTRYNMEIDKGSIPAGMLGMLMDKLDNAPKAYIEQFPGDKKNTFIGYEENKETGEFEKRWETVRNLQYKILKKKEFNPDGEIRTHEEFEYTESGDIISTKNILEGTELINEFDANGNITLEKEAFGKKEYIYDEKGNLIKTIFYSGSGDYFSVQSVSMREIEYK